MSCRHTTRRGRGKLRFGSAACRVCRHVHIATCGGGGGVAAGTSKAASLSLECVATSLFSPSLDGGAQQALQYVGSGTRRDPARDPATRRQPVMHIPCPCCIQQEHKPCSLFGEKSERMRRRASDMLESRRLIYRARPLGTTTHVMIRH